MTAVTSLNLIDALNYYLVAAFAVGTVLRVRNYRAMLGLVYRSADRWPKLRALVRSHRAIFLRWPTVLPAALALALLVANALASRFVWVDARVTPADLLGFLALLPSQEENSIVQQFRAWVRQLPPAGTPPTP